MNEYQQLADYRRRVAALYADARTGEGEVAARWARWRAGRDTLFATHPQSALSPAQKASFSELSYFRYDPALRYVLPVDREVEPGIIEVELAHDGLTRLQRWGKVHFEVAGTPLSLSLFWVLGYGGGIFLPFRDGTNQGKSYGGGRYLLDTIKHADLGEVGGNIVLDFNFAYNPSCAYNPQWHCPLAPQENWLKVPLEAGEWAYPDETVE